MQVFQELLQVSSQLDPVALQCIKMKDSYFISICPKGDQAPMLQLAVALPSRFVELFDLG